MEKSENLGPRVDVDLAPEHDPQQGSDGGRDHLTWATERMRGVALCGTIAMAATFLSQHYGAPVMLFALLLGMALNSISTVPALMPGIAFSSSTILRLGVALLGVRITLGDVMALGSLPILLAVGAVTMMVSLGILLARLFKRPMAFGILTGGAVGICGASAALALASVLPRSPASSSQPSGITERCVIFTVLGVTTLSTVAMIVYPMLAQAFGLDDRSAGIFIGATVHDVAQVVGAGYSISRETGDVATVTKLFRVALLVPVVAALGVLFMAAREPASGEATTVRQRAVLPPFLIAFVVIVVLNSFGVIAGAVQSVLSDASRWCLVTAIAALGMKTAVRELWDMGPVPLAFIVIETVVLAATVLVVLAY